jgi:hypothetical protein
MGRSNPAVAAVNHCLLVIWGSSSGDLSVVLFDTRREVWWRLPSLETDRPGAGVGDPQIFERYATVAVPFGSSHVFVLGGLGTYLDSSKKLHFQSPLSTDNASLLRSWFEFARDNVEQVLVDLNSAALCAE